VYAALRNKLLLFHCRLQDEMEKQKKEMEEKIEQADGKRFFG
jgi:hypothetical protein